MSSWQEILDDCRTLPWPQSSGQEFREALEECWRRYEALVLQGREKMAQVRDEDWRGLHEGLEDPSTRLLVALIICGSAIPEWFFPALVKAAVYETNPSANRAFVDPGLEAFGPRVVAERLLEYFERGSNFEKAGAASALYWVHIARLEERKVGAVTGLPWVHGTRTKLSDVWERKQRLFLKEFIENENLDVRRILISLIEHRVEEQPEEHRPLVLRALEIARTHPDDYIRQRVEPNVSDSGFLLASALPERTSE